jgi:L-ascorbate metabolism protein UlaG (beta-lactamase superfamily)
VIPADTAGTARFRPGLPSSWQRPAAFRDRRTHPLPGLADLIKIALRGGWALRDLSDAGRIPVRPQPLPGLGPGESSVTWVGHATTLVRTGGRAVLIDPLWSEKIPGARTRLTPPGLDWDRLPAIDAVLITHDHSDHLDRPTLRRLPRDTTVLVPARVGAWFRRNGFTTVIELDWWERASAHGLELTLVPAHHWSGRGPFSLYASLWGGWIITSPGGHRVYHAGDTAYGPCFRRIGERFPGIDLAIMPTGSFAPRWFQSSAHIDPQHAVRACAEAGAARMLPVHWGTLVLGTEPLLAPMDETVRAWRDTGLPPAGLWALAIGESRLLPARIPSPTGVFGGDSIYGGAPAV